MAVSKRLRYEVLRRDNHACRYCGATAPEATLTVDHVVPVALGGSDDPSNLVAACAACNSGKTSVPADAALVADVAQDAVRWAAAIKLATTEALTRRDEQIEVEKRIAGVFQDYPVASYRGGGTYFDYVPGDWFESVDRLIRAGLAVEELVDAALVAVNARDVKPHSAFRYFCGVAWNKARDRQEAARALIAEQGSKPEGNPYASDEAYALMQFTELSWVCDGRT